MSFLESTTTRNPNISPSLSMARGVGFHYRLLVTLAIRIGPKLKLDSKAVTHDFEAFKAGCDVIVTNRWSDELADVADKVYMRDLFKRD